MKEIEFKLAVQVYSSMEDLPTDEQTLLKEAVAALANAYAPYSNFKVGAALLLANGKMVTGSNQENAAFPAGICAEGTAFSTASSLYPGSAILKVAVTVKSARRIIDAPVAPCGICRQRMLEYENRYNQPIAVIMMGEEGEVYKVASVKKLLPLSFSMNSL